MTAALAPSAWPGRNPALNAFSTLATRWFWWLALPALALGVLLYPDMHTRTMGTAIGAGVVGLVLGAGLLRGSGKMLVAIPLGVSFLPSTTAAFLAGAVVLFILALLLGVRRAARPLEASDGALLAVLAWGGLAWLLNLGQQTDIWSLPVAVLMFWTPWLLVFLLRAASWQRRELHQLGALWLALILVQALPAIVKPVVVRQLAAYLVPLLPLELLGVRLPGHDAIAAAADFTTGTMRSAHHLGVVAILGAIFCLAVFWRTGGRRHLAGAAVLTFLVLMADAKHVVLSAAMVAVPAFGMLVWPELSRRARGVLATITLVVALGGAALAGTAILGLVRSGLWQPLVGVAAFNPKVQLIGRTAALMKPNELHTWIGYGPGAFASRAASSRATGVLFKEEAQLPAFIPSYTPPAYAGVVYDLYTADIATTTRFRSGMLTNPFSSLVGIIAEYGLLGSILFAVFVGLVVRTGLRAWRDTRRPAPWRAFGATLVVAMPLLLVLSFFDSYFEQPDVVIPVAILWLLASGAPSSSASS